MFNALSFHISSYRIHQSRIWQSGQKRQIIDKGKMFNSSQEAKSLIHSKPSLRTGESISTSEVLVGAGTRRVGTIARHDPNTDKNMVSEPQIQIQETAAKFRKLQRHSTTESFHFSSTKRGVFKSHVVATLHGACAKLCIRILYCRTASWVPKLQHVMM